MDEFLNQKYLFDFFTYFTIEAMLDFISKDVKKYACVSDFPPPGDL